MFFHRWEASILAGTTVENKGKLILTKKSLLALNWSAFGFLNLVQSVS